MANMQVTVVDGNNVTVSLDRGVAGVGIASVQIVVISNANYLLITYTNGTTQTVGPIGIVAYTGTSPINIAGTVISLTTVPINLGGTGQTTAIAGLNALLPVQTSQANKYLQTDGTNASWDAVSLSTADITGVLPVANGGTGVSTSTGTGNTVLSTSPTLITPVLGTPASATLTNATGLPVASGISGLGTGIATFLATPSSANLAAALTDETGTGAAVFATSPTLVTPALGTPASGVMTNVTGTAAGLTAGNVTTNANLTGMVTSVGNATTVVTNANLTGGVTSIGNAATVITNANLTGDITSVGNATAIAAGVIVNADINASAAIDDTKLATIATALKVSNSATTAVSTNTASAIVARDASGNFSAGTITAALTGNASTATALATGRTIAITGDLAYTSPSFDGTGNVTAAGTLATVATAGVTGSSTAIPVVTINAKGLTTSITTAAVIAPANTLSGNTLAAGVTASSLTSLGTIANLSVTAGTISTTPSASTDIANKDYVDTVAQGLDPKASCVAATTVNITLSGTQTIDGVALIAADRCLVKDQTAPADNGIYVVAAGAWARSTDMNVWLEVPGAFTFIEQGTLYADTGWVCTSNAGGTLGTTAITFVQFAGVGSYTASTGLTLTGTAFSLTAPVTVALGGTNATSAGIASFNNITGYTAAGATGTTSTNLVFSTSPTLVTPNLGTPTSLVLTSATGLPLTTGVTGTLPVANGGTGVTTSTGTTNVVLSNSPTLVTPALGAATATSLVSSGTAASSFTVTSGSAVPLTITNTGSGNSFVVEDSASTDSTPFVITANGTTVVGSTASFAGIFGNAANLQVASVAAHPVQFARFGNDVFGADVQILKSRNATPGGQAVLQSGDSISSIYFGGSDGTNYIPAASILVQIDGTPGTNDMPGRLVFSTTADGGSSPTERMRIDSAGNVGIGGTASAFSKTLIGGTLPTSSLVSQAVRITATIPSGSTTSATIFESIPITQAAAFTLSNLLHFNVNPQTFGAGSTVTNQQGFTAATTLTGATNNYGFYSNIASAANRFNFYAQGTADNYFAGSVGIGAVPTSASKAAIVNTSAGASTIALALQNLSDTINTETVLDISCYSGTTPGVRSAQITALNVSGGTSVNMVFKISNGAVPAEAMRITSVGGLQLTRGVGVSNTTPRATGVSFPATAVAPGDANTLGDYEEGTWTPVVTFTGGNGDLTTAEAAGVYTKIGRLVQISFNVEFTETTALTNLTITGVPFTSGGVSRSAAGCFIDNMTSVSGAPVILLGLGSTTITVSQTRTGAEAAITNSNTGASSRVRGILTYSI